MILFDKMLFDLVSLNAFFTPLDKLMFDLLKIQNVVWSCQTKCFPHPLKDKKTFDLLRQHLIEILRHIIVLLSWTSWCLIFMDKLLFELLKYNLADILIISISTAREGSFAAGTSQTSWRSQGSSSTKLSYSCHSCHLNPDTLWLLQWLDASCQTFIHSKSRMTMPSDLISWDLLSVHRLAT